MNLTLRFGTPVAGLLGLLAAIPAAHGADAREAAAAPIIQALVIQALVGTTALLADDADRESDRSEGRRSRESSRGERGESSRGERGEAGRGERGEAGRGDARAMMNEIMARLSRIEQMLGERGPMMGRGPGRSEISPEMKQQWEARMKEGREKMKEARTKWENASPEEREEMKSKWEARMKEGREKREQTKQARPEGNEGPQMPEEVRRKMEEARRMVDEARKRAAEMENRVKRLEAELERMKMNDKESTDEEF